MSRLIDADEVVETLFCTPDVEEIFLNLAQKRRLDYLHNVEENDVVDFARDIVKAAIGVIKTSPIVDAEPIRHGKWIPKLIPTGVSAYGVDEMTAELEECSLCHKLYSVQDEKRYCPYCGAKMDGERKEE